MRRSSLQSFLALPVHRQYPQQLLLIPALTLTLFHMQPWQDGGGTYVEVDHFHTSLAVLQLAV